MQRAKLLQPRTVIWGVPQPSAPQPSAAASDGFMNIPDGLEEELPFS